MEQSTPDKCVSDFSCLRSRKEVTEEYMVEGMGRWQEAMQEEEDTTDC